MNLKSKSKVLIVDDEESVRYSFRKLLKEPEFSVEVAGNGMEGVEAVKRQKFDLVVLDIEMPELNGLDALLRIKEITPKTPVLIITAYGSSERVITAMKYGAFDYIEKPFDVPRLRDLIDEALRTGYLMDNKVVFDNKEVEDWSASHIIGNAHAIKEVYKMVGKVAASDANILLVGESGTGKELVARAIYNHSSRSHKQFLTLNCAAIPENLLESELFGFEKGSFTGADRTKPGKFEMAHQGTLFLDEIAEMSLTLQAKLLRVLQEGTFEHIGGDKTIRTDVRIIAATNKNLETSIAGKTFREDLYYRLKVITITLPPLRMRKEDIPLLINYFIHKHCFELKHSPVSVTPETFDLLMAYHYPGNVRELENLLKRAILLSRNDIITPDIIQQDLAAAPAPEMVSAPGRLSHYLPPDPGVHFGNLYKTVIEDVEKELLLHALNVNEGNQVKTARMLGISRVMLHDRLEKYGLKPEGSTKREEE